VLQAKEGLGIEGGAVVKMDGIDVVFGREAFDGLYLGDSRASGDALKHQAGAEFKVADEASGDDSLSQGAQGVDGVAELPILPGVGNVQDSLKGVGCCCLHEIRDRQKITRKASDPKAGLYCNTVR
jgi:hypothetical protein